MRRNDDTIIALGVSCFAVGLAVFNVFCPWVVSAVILLLGSLVGYGALKVHFED